MEPRRTSKYQQRRGYRSPKPPQTAHPTSARLTAARAGADDTAAAALKHCGFSKIQNFSCGGRGPNTRAAPPARPQNAPRPMEQRGSSILQQRGSSILALRPFGKFLNCAAWVTEPAMPTRLCPPTMTRRYFTATTVIGSGTHLLKRKRMLQSNHHGPSRRGGCFSRSSY